MRTDMVIVGSGCAGLYCALHLPREKQVTIITKLDAESSDSYLAQGGMCVQRDDEDYHRFMEDTLKAGHYENDRNAVDVMIRSSRDVLEDLLAYGVAFQKDENGELLYTREGAHSNKRILFHADITGREITSKLLAEVKRRPNITLHEYTTMIDLIVENNRCKGIVVETADGAVQEIRASFTILATGGIGGRYAHSTNYRHLTGDGITVAEKYNIELKDMDYIQIHPTTFYTEDKTERSFLISESVRGEGAKLRDKNGNRFVDELLPRDLLTKAIYEQMKKDGTEFVWEDLREIPESELDSHFPNIVKYCLEHGYDVRKECIPVVPAQHYFMGGIKVSDVSKTSMERLYAVGETACNGVHGKNRLASNSLLESLVFAKRAARDISGNHKKRGRTMLFDQTTLKLNVDPLIKSAIREDVTSEDVSANSVMPESRLGEVDLICKQDGIICGLPIFERVFKIMDENTEVEMFVKDGDAVVKGQLMAKIRGDIRVLLGGERTALNYLQRMSGIATYTRSVAELLEGTKTKLLDTRKTSPNNRIFEKYAVRVGGGNNHRFNLSDGVLLKDNHIGAAGSVKRAIEMAKEYAPFVRKIEVEVETLEMVREAADAGADIIMLDNMTHEQMEEAIRIIDGRAEVEVSGNVTKENIAKLTDLGVDCISSGALTHSAPIMDLSLKNLHAIE